MCLIPKEGNERDSHALELELLIHGNYQVGAGELNLVLLQDIVVLNLPNAANL